MKEQSEMFVGNLLVKMFYPNIVSFFVNKAGIEEMKKRVIQVGEIVGQKMLEIWAPKEKKIKKLIKIFFKKMWDNKVVVLKRKTKEKTTYRIIDKNCRFCNPEVMLEGVEKPCVTIVGYIQACLDYLSERSHLPVCSAMSVQTVKSRGGGDKYCEHQIELTR